MYGLAKPLLAGGPGGWSFDVGHPPRDDGVAGSLAGRLWATLEAHSAVAQLGRIRRADAARARGADGEPLSVAALRAAFLAHRWTDVTDADVELATGALADPRDPTRELLARLRDLCAGTLGASLFAFSVPHRHDQQFFSPAVLAERHGGAFGSDGPPATLLARRFDELCAELGIPTIPVEAALGRAVAAGTQLDVGDGHPNAAGHDVIAACLAEALEELVGGSR
jgi:hypothetical protein